MKKKVILSILVVISAFMITGCGNNEPQNKINEDKAPTSNPTKKEAVFRMVNNEPIKDILNVGDEIAIGKEEFYVVSDDGAKIVALAKYNLKVGYTQSDCGEDKVKVNKDVEGYGLQTSESYRTTCAFKYYMPYAEDWTTDSFDVTEYKSQAQEAVKEYQNIVNVPTRLMTSAEVVALGCEFKDIEDNCKNAPEWLKNTDFWLEPTYSEYAGSIARVIYEGHCGLDDGGFDEVYLGIRPVIEIER